MRQFRITETKLQDIPCSVLLQWFCCASVFPSPFNASPLPNNISSAHLVSLLFYLCRKQMTRIQVNIPTNLRLQILMLPVNSLYPAANSFALVCSCIYAIIIHTRVGMNLQPAIIIIFSTTYMFCLCYLIIIDAFILR